MVWSQISTNLNGDFTLIHLRKVVMCCLEHFLVSELDAKEHHHNDAVTKNVFGWNPYHEFTNLVHAMVEVDLAT